MARQVFALTLLVAFSAACGSDAAITTPDERATPGPLLAIGTDPVSGATIETDLDDYMPGEVVHLTGYGWAPNETVRMFMTEDPDTHDDVTMDVVADSAGVFSVHFYDVQPHDIGVTFTLTATGQTSGSVAVATFTDNVPVTALTLNGLAAVTVGPSAVMTASVVGAVNGGGSNKTLGSLAIRAYLDGANPTTSVQLTCFDVDPNIVHVSGGAINFTRAFPVPAPPGAGVYDVLAVSYGDNACTAAVQSLTLDNAITVIAANQAPVVDAGIDSTFDEGASLIRNGFFTDSDADTWTATVDYGDGSGVQPLTLNADKTFHLNHQYTDDGTYTVTVTVSDGTVEVSDQATMTVNNVAPTIGTKTAGANVDEGSTILFAVSDVTDPSSGDVTAGFTYAFACDGTTFDAYGSAASVSCPAGDGPGSVTIAAKAKDKDGGESDPVSSIFTVDNVAPTLTGVSGTAVPTPVNAAVSITLTFTDPATTYDTYSAAVNWDDGNGYQAPVALGAGNTVSKTFTSAGVYTVCATVQDEDGGVSSEKCYEYVVVYDPAGGFVTGGGWIMSPEGAYVSDPGLTGKATFGFVSKYEKGKTYPTGNTEFQFHAGNVNFKSTSYEWLVVAGPLGQYKGVGTINGAGNYGFLLTAKDGQASGGGGVDKFRIKIWAIGGSVVYDNALDAAEDSDASTALSGGSIVIHTKK